MARAEGGNAGVKSLDAGLAVASGVDAFSGNGKSLAYNFYFS
jgi:hypothetical protein